LNALYLRIFARPIALYNKYKAFLHGKAEDLRQSGTEARKTGGL
jgi:hypothetical protein